VLGFVNDYVPIKDLCSEKGILIIEDSCETVGTIYKNKMAGTFGDISTFSFYYGHHMSTIEGGMVCCDDPKISKILRSIRCHGWDRDLTIKDQKDLRKKYNIDDFKALYTFYYPGFNMRCSEIQAFLGLEQMKSLDARNEKRHNNFKHYFSNDLSGWSLDIENYSFISNMAYPVLCKDINETKLKLSNKNIEHRPLICGSLGRQPFWVDNYGEPKDLPNADKVHDNGIYVPNNPDLTIDELEMISNCLWQGKER
jgi:CDP-6-deoxy-D-xylo-4-hexulose-3-dehydrase